MQWKDAEMSRVAVIGAGAVGGWIAAKLVLAGQDVALLARAATSRQLRSEGLILTERGDTRRVPVTVFEKPSDIGEAALVIIAVKAPSLADAAETAGPMIGSDTVIVPLINGVPWWFLPGETLQSIDPDGRIGKALPFDQLIGSVVHAACSRIAPNQIHVAHCDRLIFGLPGGGTDERVDQLCAMFERAGIACEPSTDIRRAIWYKLWGNATINPLSALTRSTADRLIADKSLRSLMLEAMAELARVGTAIGCPIDQSGEERMAVTTRLGAFKPSMLQDLEAGRPLELDALLGAPREIARRKGVATPRLDLIDSIVRLLAGGSGQG